MPHRYLLPLQGFGRRYLISHIANLPDESISPLSSVARTGVYYGYAQVIPPAGEDRPLLEDEVKVLPMVMSLGWNPFYHNERLTAVRKVFLVKYSFPDVDDV